ncbi:MAG: hypothetical protein WC745_04655 [Patescibacteria group bacterium]|jgi:hypothetical protein
MNGKIKNLFTIIGIYAGSIFLAIILAPLGGTAHSSLLNVRCGGGLFLLEGFDRTCSIDGFIYFYILLLAAFSFSILKKKTAWIVFLTGSSIFWLATILFIFMDWPNIEFDETAGSFFIMLVSFAIGYLLAQGILFAKKKLI